MRRSRRATLKVISVVTNSDTPKISLDELVSKLQTAREILINKHQSLFLEELDDMINKIKLFGFHFAT